MSNSTVKPLVAAARGLTPTRQPIWFMRQAGRYLPEYREVRSKVAFVDLCRSPELAAEVTLQPLRRYDLDAAIIFSDILIPCTAMGQTLTFDKGEGPVLSQPVRSATDLGRLKRADAVRDLGYVGEAIAKTKAGLRSDQTMIGFAGAPFTVASYMIEGGGSKTFTEVKRLLFREPAVFAGLLDLIADVTCDYLAMQVKSGADALMLFDTWAGQLTGFDYRNLVFPVTNKVTAYARTLGVPVTYFPGQGTDRMFNLAGLDVDVISVDWRTTLTAASKTLRDVGLDVAVQGNLDPQILIAPESTVRERVRRILQEARELKLKGHIFNVGHGLLPHTPPESLTWVIDEVRAFR
ncbi:MAG: uroporphyrinogen decarboxylase [Deltaproteobacteria bacterium]|nr:uroporphyrinogen decarboxylase [Deltaproteobacteria bacterium]